MPQRIPMTVRGKQLLQEKLKHLKEVERPAIVKEIEIARAHGDLSENAEYQYAKDQQGIIETQIRELESKLSSAEVIDPAKLNSDRVVFGATVCIMDLETEKEETYQIVGADESDFENGLLSVESALARSMMGKTEGDDFVVRTSRGPRRMEVVSVVFK